MSGNSFRSVFMVASCAGAALACYLVSLRVASERAALEAVETEIVVAERDIRVLQTEIGTRGRLAQLERWNVKVLALSAPSADQFVGTSFELARMVAPKRQVDLEAPVVLASAPAPERERQLVPKSSGDAAAPPELLHTASLKRSLPETETTAKPAAVPKPVSPKISVDKPTPAAPKPVTRPVKIAKADPLAPLPDSQSARTPKPKAAKDSRPTP